MLATLGGVLALVLGLTILLLPLVATELSRPRDTVWGAVVLLLGLVLVTCADRLTGAPMLGVLCGGLLIGRLGLEVGQARWRVLSSEEQQRLWSRERWQTSLSELVASARRLADLAAGLVTGLLHWFQERRQPRPAAKRWVRQEASAGQVPAAAPEEEAGEGPTIPGPTPVVTSLEGVEALLRAAPPAEGEPDEQETGGREVDEREEAAGAKPPPQTGKEPPPESSPAKGQGETG